VYGAEPLYKKSNTQRLFLTGNCQGITAHFIVNSWESDTGKKPIFVKCVDSGSFIIDVDMDAEDVPQKFLIKGVVLEVKNTYWLRIKNLPEDGLDALNDTFHQKLGFSCTLENLRDNTADIYFQTLQNKNQFAIWAEQSCIRIWGRIILLEDHISTVSSNISGDRKKKITKKMKANNMKSEFRFYREENPADAVAVTLGTPGSFVPKWMEPVQAIPISPSSPKDHMPIAVPKASRAYLPYRQNLRVIPPAETEEKRGVKRKRNSMPVEFPSQQYIGEHGRLDAVYDKDIIPFYVKLEDIGETYLLFEED